MNNEFRFHLSAGAPPAHGLVPQDRALPLLTTAARPKRQVLPPSPALGNLWPWAGSKKQLHIVPECLPNEKIITFRNCSASGPGPVSDKETLAWEGRGAAPSSRIPTLISPFSCSAQLPMSVWESKKFLRGGKRGEKQRIQHWQWDLPSFLLLLLTPSIFLTWSWGCGADLTPQTQQQIAKFTIIIAIIFYNNNYSHKARAAFSPKVTASFRKENAFKITESNHDWDTSSSTKMTN